MGRVMTTTWLCCVVLCCVVLQVIIRYEMSPLVRISPQKKVCSSVLNKVIAMLAAKPDRRIKLLE